MAFFRRTPKADPHAESLARAVPATATVVLAKQATHTAQDVNSSSEVYRVELDVSRSPAEPPIRQAVEWTVFRVALPDVQTGAVLTVSVDPERPEIVYPPGYPPAGHRPGTVPLGDVRILPASAWLDALL
jgi:hypothetical protein